MRARSGKNSQDATIQESNLVIDSAYCKLVKSVLQIILQTTGHRWYLQNVCWNITLIADKEPVDIDKILSYWDLPNPNKLLNWIELKL